MPGTPKASGRKQHSIDDVPVRQCAHPMRYFHLQAGIHSIKKGAVSRRYYTTTNVCIHLLTFKNGYNRQVADYV